MNSLKVFSRNLQKQKTVGILSIGSLGCRCDTDRVMGCK